MPPYYEQHDYKYDKSSEHYGDVFWDERVAEDARDFMYLVTYAHKNEGCSEDVQERKFWDQHQYSLGVMRQPYVVLSYKQLRGKEN